MIAYYTYAASGRAAQQLRNQVYIGRFSNLQFMSSASGHAGITDYM